MASLATFRPSSVQWYLRMADGTAGFSPRAMAVAVTLSLPEAGSERPLAETASTITFAVGTPLHEMERRMLFKTLAFYDNNKARTAQALGITTKTIYNRLTAYQAQLRDNPEKHDASGSGDAA